MRSWILGKRFLSVALSRSEAARCAVWSLAAGAAVLAAVASHAAEAKGPSASPAGGGAAVEEITFRSEGSGLEIVCLRFDRPLIPVVWSIEGGKPRVVIDSEPVAQVAKKTGAMKVNGNLIRTIRSYLNRKMQRLRVVLDMKAGRDYYVDQTFREADNLYCLSVTEQAPAPAETKAVP